MAITWWGGGFAVLLLVVVLGLIRLGGTDSA
jgi:hypothetical protein